MMGYLIWLIVVGCWLFGRLSKKCNRIDAIGPGMNIHDPVIPGLRSTPCRRGWGLYVCNHRQNPWVFAPLREMCPNNEPRSTTTIHSVQKHFILSETVGQTTVSGFDGVHRMIGMHRPQDTVGQGSFIENNRNFRFPVFKG
jgi:hypothetical protein